MKFVHSAALRRRLAFPADEEKTCTRRLPKILAAELWMQTEWRTFEAGVTVCYRGFTHNGHAVEFFNIWTRDGT